MQNARVATVFGGSGFIGRAVIQRLAAAGYTVRIPTRDVVSAGRLRTAGAVGQIVPMFCPLRSEPAIRAAVAGADVVINLIGILYEKRRNTFDRVQGELPGLIATTAAAAGVDRLVHISAIGANATGRSKYARSKAAGEAAVRTAFPAATILRPSIVFGPEDNFFNLFGKMAKAAPFLPLIGGGKTKFQPVYVGDVADAVMAVLDRQDAAGKTFELGGPEIVTFRDLMQKTLDWSGQKRCLLSIPYPLATAEAAILQLLPRPLLTCDQVQLLKTDNVVSPTSLSLADLGIRPVSMTSIVPSYLSRLKPGGAFAKTG